MEYASGGLAYIAAHIQKGGENTEMYKLSTNGFDIGEDMGLRVLGLQVFPPWANL